MKRAEEKRKEPAACDFSEFEPPRSEQFISTGYMLGLLQIMPAQLRLLMREAKVSFARSVDGQGQLSIFDAEKVAAKCRDLNMEIHGAIQKVRAAARN